jgi:hypothetical protein
VITKLATNNKERRARADVVSTLVDLTKARVDIVECRMDRLELCLYGQDGRGGLCKDIAEIKRDLGAATSFLRIFVVPVIMVLVAGVIGYLVSKIP